jgi:hypothetical protein
MGHRNRSRVNDDTTYELEAHLANGGLSWAIDLLYEEHPAIVRFARRAGQFLNMVHFLSDITWQDIQVMLSNDSSGVYD